MDRNDYLYLEHKIMEMEKRLGNSVETIKVKYFADIEPITPITNGDWVDLRCSQDTFIHRGIYKLIPLGVAMQLPKGYEAIIAPRSSTYKNEHIIMTNSIGVIDESYCGDDDMWRFPAYATEDTLIKKGTRICQFRIIKHQPKIEFETVDNLRNKNRGGIGSTGRI